MNGTNAHVRSRPGRARRSIVFFLVLLAVLITSRRRRETHVRRSDESAPPAAAAAAPYARSADENLGAAVAIMVDNSGSMAKRAGGDSRPKYVVAREALQQMLASTDSFIAKQPGFPIKVGLYQFSSTVRPLVPLQAYDRAALRRALESMEAPNGGTAIGDAMDTAREALYQSGIIRKYILVVTDGENTDGRSPDDVAREIARRSEGAVRMYFVAFDIDAQKFSFVREVRGEVLGARDGLALRASLDTIYRGKILAEAVDAGESLPSPAKKP
jgi:Mg-chelatase subunit ChlD